MRHLPLSPNCSPCTILSPFQAILHVAAKENLLKCKFSPITLLIKTFQTLFVHFRIKSQLRMIASEALWGPQAAYLLPPHCSFLLHRRCPGKTKGPETLRALPGSTQVASSARVRSCPCWPGNGTPSPPVKLSSDLSTCVTPFPAVSPHRELYFNC